MARGRRKLIIQSHDEYMSEEHIGQESHGQNTEASELHPSARGDQIDSDGDIEVNFHDETEDRVKRGKTKLKDIWNLPRGHRIVVRCNEFDQPIGVEAGFLGKFLGIQKLDGVQLGKEFWMVHVSIAIVDDEPLIRPYKGYKVIGDIEGVTIAWPSTFIKKINA